jgi:hypothetical protein
MGNVLFVDIYFPSLADIDMKMLKRERGTAQYCLTLNVMVEELLDGMVFHVSSKYLMWFDWHTLAPRGYKTLLQQ